MKITIIGTSLTEHWVEFLGEYLDENFSYEFLSGGTSQESLDLLKKKKPIAELLLISTGIKDLGRDPVTRGLVTSLEDFTENLGNIFTVSKKHAKDVAYISLLPFDQSQHNTHRKDVFRYESDLKDFHKASKAVCVEYNIDILDLGAYTKKTNKPAKYIDHIHLPYSIRNKQAAFVAKWVKKKTN